MTFFRRATALAEARWAVVDCETSGLDPADRLLSVGAVIVSGGRVQLGECFGALVRQAQPSARDNVLVHGIGADAQLGGQPQPEVIAQLERFIAGAVPVAFHAVFDAAILKRAGLSRRRWLDLDPLARALCPDRRLRSLDEWLDFFAIEHPGRHDALLDACAAAELLLALIAQGRRQGSRTVEDLLAVAGGAKWLAPR